MEAHDGSSRFRPEEMALIANWLGQLLGSEAEEARHGADAPFSFLCGERSSRDWLPLAEAEAGTGDWQEGRRTHALRWRDDVSSLACELELAEFADFPALEWVVRLRNEGAADSAPVSSFRALDTVWRSADPHVVPELRRALGSDGRHDDFLYDCRELRQSMWSVPCVVRMDTERNNAFRRARNGSCLPADGRPSATWLPFFNLRTGDDGLIGAVGWSGQWFAEFAHDGTGATRLGAGMEHLNASLRPGESIRSPRILLLYWAGDPMHGHNLLRRFILAHHSPGIDNVPICDGAWGGTPTQGHLDAIAGIAKHGLPYDYYWVDAGWYGTSTKPCPNVFEGDWSTTGDWRVNRTYHPDGLKPISEAAHAAGMKFLLWIEPERATHGTPVTLEHPEWFLRRTAAPPQPRENLLLDLGNPEAWQWAVETVSSLIVENGIDGYREDFNVDPSPYWQQADKEGREGLSELRFVEGLYAFWDELRRRHPHLLIDNCASGGRRLELEMLGRSIPLWRSDYNCFPHADADAIQSHTLGLHLWLPQNATSPPPVTEDQYQVRSSYSSGLVLSLRKFGLDDDGQELPWGAFRKWLEEARRLRPLFSGDIYPLTPGTVDHASWLAYQLLVPATGDGAVIAFRRPESRQSAATFQLRGLTSGTYEMEDADTGESWQDDGDKLQTAGLSIHMPEPRSSRIVFYRKTHPSS
jgi:alpha-galactosidase